MSTTSVLVAIVLVCAAVVLARGGRPELRLQRRGPSAPVSSSVAAAWTARALVRWRRRRTDAVVVGVLVESWAAQLRAGRPVGAGLADAFEDVPPAAALLPRTSIAVVLDADVATALRGDAEALSGPARRALLAAGAFWSVAQDNGGRLADALDRLGDGIRADEQHAAHVRAQLAGPRATARLLAALPVFALLLGASLGLSPWRVLLGEPYGRLALSVGLGLDVAGLVWTERMARTTERAA